MALSRHDTARALNLLGFSETTLLPPRLRQRALELRARAQLAAGDALNSARTRAALNRRLGGADRSQNEAQIMNTLAQLDPETLKQQGTSLLPNDALRPFVDQALHRNGQALPQAVQSPDQQVGTLVPGQNANNGEGYRAAHVVALLLPVEGQIKAVAQAIRDGFFAAYFSDAHQPRPEVRVYDSGNTVADATMTYQRAVSEAPIMWSGPLAPRRSLGRVRTGQLAGAGTCALNRRAWRGAAAGQRRIRPDPGHRRRAGGRTHARARHHARGDHRCQRRLVRARRGCVYITPSSRKPHGVILGETRLHEGDVNYSSVIRQALGTLPTSAATTPLPGAATPSVDMSAAHDTGIFISMRPQQARLLLPQIKLAGYSSTPVFATSHVFAGNVNPGMDRDLDGAGIHDAPWLFDAVLGLPTRHSDIANSLDSARGAGARLFAMGLDAYALVPYLDWLAQHASSYLPGATGQLTTDGLGRVQRVLIWARFADGVAQPVNGSLQMSNAPGQ